MNFDKARRLRFVASLLAAAALAPGAALAQGPAPPTPAPPPQLPAHDPGTLCVTTIGYCGAEPAGPPGSPCVCQTPRGVVGGVRG